MNRREAILAGFTALTTTAVLSSAAGAETSPTENPEIAPIRQLLKAHDDAFANQDLDGVMACLASKSVIMGTGPGEIWSGPDEIKDAYQHFFKGFDKGEEHFEYSFRLGGVSPEMGWLVTAGNVIGKKEGKDASYPLNVSLVVSKEAGQWKISAMHFSTLTGASSGTGDSQ